MTGEPGPVPLIGLSALTRVVFAGAGASDVASGLLARFDADPADAGASMDLATLCRLRGLDREADAFQASALARRRHYRVADPTPGAPRVLALVAPGNLQANTPVEFLLDGSGFGLNLLVLGPGDRLPDALPEHDVAMLCIAWSEANAPILHALAAARGWPERLVNSATGVLLTERERFAALAGRSPAILAPPLRRVPRQVLTSQGLAAAPFPAPWLVRPVGSHAGLDLERIAAEADMRAYLEGQPAEDFYASAFVDTRGADGMCRKTRVALVGGRPFISHMAISSDWKVHYYSAGMTDRQDGRRAEALAMEAFDSGFAVRHAAAFRHIHEATGLDYLTIDCTDAPDGRLLVFEADTGMIVHDMDPPGLFSYKRDPMKRLFGAFRAMLEAKAGR